MPRKNITSKNVGAWLGGNRGYVQSGSNTDTSAKADAGGGQMESVRGELGLGAYTAGIGTTAAIGAGVAAVRSGRAAQAVNKLTGKTVIVHSSPAKGLKTIEPRVAPAAPEAGARVFGARPSNRAPAYDYESMVRIGRHYVSERSAQAQSALGKTVTGYEGSMYVAKVPTKTLEGANAYVRSPVPAKVVKEIPISGPMPYRSAVDAEDVRKLERAFRRAGGRPLKAPKEPKISKTSKSSRPRS